LQLKHGPLTWVAALDELPCPVLAWGTTILKGFWFLWGCWAFWFFLWGGLNLAPGAGKRYTKRLAIGALGYDGPDSKALLWVLDAVYTLLFFSCFKQSLIKSLKLVLVLVPTYFIILGFNPSWNQRSSWHQY
jgi:hypothetical protein